MYIIIDITRRLYIQFLSHKCIGLYWDWRDDIMVTKLFMELKNLFADLASTLILGKNKDAANLARILSEKSKALADELGK